MVIGIGKVYLQAEWVYSLKEKRMVVKSLAAKTANKFNVSVAEVEAQDNHKTIVLGFACVSNEAAHADAMVQRILRFMEDNTDAVVTDTGVEIYHTGI